MEKFNFPPVALPLIYVVLKDHGSDYEVVKNLLLEGETLLRVCIMLFDRACLPISFLKRA